MEVLLLFISQNVDIVRVVDRVGQVILVEQLGQAGLLPQARRLALVHPDLPYPCTKTTPIGYSDISEIFGALTVGIERPVGYQSNTGQGEEACLDLGGNLDPEALGVGVVEIDDFEKEDDNRGAPEDCTRSRSDSGSSSIRMEPTYRPRSRICP